MHIWNWETFAQVFFFGVLFFNDYMIFCFGESQLFSSGKNRLLVKYSMPIYYYDTLGKRTRIETKSITRTILNQFRNLLLFMSPFRFHNFMFFFVIFFSLLFSASKWFVSYHMRCDIFSSFHNCACLYNGNVFRNRCAQLNIVRNSFPCFFPFSCFLQSHERWLRILFEQKLANCTKL